MIDQDDVLEALSNVIDPELGLDFVELGLVYGVEIDGGTVNVTFTLTTPACPIGPQVSEQMQEFVGELPGVEQVVPNMVFTPAWTPDKCRKTPSSHSATEGDAAHPTLRRGLSTSPRGGAAAAPPLTAPHVPRR